MLSDKMQKALNEQVNAELFSAYLYLSMCAHFQSQGLPGFANWMRVQTQEEMMHGMKIYDFIHERGGKVALEAIAQPETKWASPKDVFAATLEHERKVTSLINELVDLAVKQKDHATQIFLQWFVTEQVEEESSASAILDRLRLIGKDASTLFMLDQELAQRVFTPPAAV